MDRPSSFLVTLPKAELHLHLEGSIDPTTLVELRKRHGKSSTLAEIEQLYRYDDFNGFLMAFKAVTEDLQTPEDYELITYRMMERLRAENVLHAEVYVSVGVCLWRKKDLNDLRGAGSRRRRGERDFGVSLLWIFDAVRQFGPGAAREVFGTAVRFRERDVVAVGIGGDEQKGPPELFREAYAYAADYGMTLYRSRGGKCRVGIDLGRTQSAGGTNWAWTGCSPGNWWKNWQPGRCRLKFA